MNGEAIASVSAAVVVLTQLAKWSGVPNRWGPAVVMALSLVGVAFWAWAEGSIARAQAFEFFAGWIAVATSAAGVYGFTRAGVESVTRTTPPERPSDL